MDKIKESDLKYQYSWSTIGGDDPNKRRHDKIFLNRNEGYEVLDFINKYANDHNLSRVDALKIEKIIKENVPTNIHGIPTITAYLDKFLRK